MLLVRKENFEKVLGMAVVAASKASYNPECFSLSDINRESQYCNELSKIVGAIEEKFGVNIYDDVRKIKTQVDENNLSNVDVSLELLKDVFDSEVKVLAPNVEQYISDNASKELIDSAIIDDEAVFVNERNYTEVDYGDSMFKLQIWKADESSLEELRRFEVYSEIIPIIQDKIEKLYIVKANGDSDYKLSQAYIKGCDKEYYFQMGNINVMKGGPDVFSDKELVSMDSSEVITRIYGRPRQFANYFSKRYLNSFKSFVLGEESKINRTFN